MEKIEEILRNKILFIGNEIPEFFTKDKRDKQLYLGYPQQLIDELSKELSSLIREERKDIKLPKKRKTCDCEDSLLGYHTKDCSFYEYGWNDCIKEVKRLNKRNDIRNLEKKK